MIRFIKSGACIGLGYAKGAETTLEAALEKELVESGFAEVVEKAVKPKPEDVEKAVKKK